MLYALSWGFGTHYLLWASKCQLIRSLPNSKDPSSISSPLLGMCHIPNLTYVFQALPSITKSPKYSNLV